MCPNDTVFDQENFICANWFEIDCRSSTLFYDKNLQLFQPDERNKAGSGVTSTTDQPSEQQKRQQEQQLKQLMVLEEQQAAQVLRQQQVLEQHEKRQQEHQVTSLDFLISHYLFALKQRETADMCDHVEITHSVMASLVFSPKWNTFTSALCHPSESRSA